MKRGEIYYADLNPTIGSEVAKCRPVLIVSNNINNRVASTITVAPLTSPSNGSIHLRGRMSPLRPHPKSLSQAWERDFKL
ncbi:MAG: type II toxin-antitoxin system PemK/MazF family toxin [Oscillatoriales cyanobacterium C42_A2020_001]|nr:type II toxin-antitoxin system PemK/MazF family toxin [Leptolyngbyaceae cyanobacterium C42_A2020_001]